MAGTVNEQYTLDVNVQENGAAESGVNVRAWNVATTSVLNKTTDVNGDITPTILTSVQHVLTESALSAAISDDGGVQTDETTDANSATANDVVLVPATAVAGDAFYVGMSAEFDQIRFNVGTAGTGTYTLSWSYWNGTAWSSLTVFDDTDNFKTAGSNTVGFSRPGDWATTTVNTQGPFYYVRAVVDATPTGGNALGTQIWTTARVSTTRNPFKLRALKWLLNILEVSINLSAPSEQTLFMATNPNITETNQTTVNGYTGFVIDHVADRITLNGGTWNPERLYDRVQSEAITNPQEDIVNGQALETVDGVNFIQRYDLQLLVIAFNGGGASYSGTWESRNLATLSNITVEDLNLTTAPQTTLTDINVNGTLDFAVAQTYTLTGCEINEVTNSSGGNVTLNLNNSTVTTNTGPNITIIDTVTLTLIGIETDSEVNITNLDDVENFNKELTGIEQVLGSVQSVSIVDGGTGYTVADTLTVQGGTGTAATLTVDAVSGGVITAVSINTAGSYSANPSNPASVTGGTGNNDATFNLDISGTFTYNYDSSFNPTVAIVVFNLDFIEVRIVQPLAAQSQTIPIQQRIDRTFSNP